MAISVRSHVYRDTPGFLVGGRRKGGTGFPYSIFVRCRSTAVLIKKLLNSDLPFAKLSKHLDTLIHADSRVKFCRR